MKAPCLQKQSTAACQRLQALLPRAVEGELDESQRARIARHADDCPECRGELGWQEALHEAIAAEPLRAPPPVYFEGVLAVVHQRMPLVRPGPVARRRPRIGRQAAASLFIYGLFLVSMTGFLFNSGRRGADELAHYGRSSLSAARVVASSAGRQARQLGVWVRGLGHVPGGLPLRKMSDVELAELGIVRSINSNDEITFYLRG